MKPAYFLNVEQDVSKEDFNYFIQSFRSYNQQFVKKNEPKQLFVVVRDMNEKVVAFSQGTIIWGWLDIQKLWVEKSFRQQGLGSLLMKSVENEAIKEGIKKASIGTFLEGNILFLNKCGYQTAGTLKNRPPGYTFSYLIKELNKKHSIVQLPQYSVALKDEIADEKLEMISKKINEENELILGEQFYRDVKIFARDKNDHIIGGLTGYIGWGWLYISVLWVKSDYRNKGLGTELVQKAEAMARNEGVKHSFLGTTEFQAREFYEKLGYEVFLTRDELPPGYKNFSMKKSL